MELTDHQKNEFAKLQQALDEGKNPVVLAGAAGTGKTTLMGYMSKAFRKPIFLAPTNRAALVLRSKMPAGSRVLTIHAACARVSSITHEDAIKAIRGLIRLAGSQEEDVCDAVRASVDIQTQGPNPVKNLDLSGLRWETPQLLKQSLRRALRQAERDNQIVFQGNRGQSVAATHVVIDEASMVTDELLAYVTDMFGNIPIALIGDRFQLPPVLDNSNSQATGGVLDLLTPTAELTEVMRQAKQSKILAFATWIRKQKKSLRTYKLAGNKTPDLEFVRRPKSGVTKGLLREFAEKADVVLCRRNDTRRLINRGLRDLDDKNSGVAWMPRKGERLVFSEAPARTALEEGRALDPVTGQQPPMDSPLNEAVKGTFFTVKDAQRQADNRGWLFIRMRGFVDGQEKPVELHVAAKHFLHTYQLDEGKHWGFPPRGWFGLDYGHCLSVHKAQGSEFPRVAVYEQAAPHTPREDGNGWLRPSAQEHRRWCYTAATRAQKFLYWVCKPL